MPICKTCNDTHTKLPGPDGERFPCMDCPTPCARCRATNYCKTTPCPCPCHAGAYADTTPAPAVAPAPAPAATPPAPAPAATPPAPAPAPPSAVTQLAPLLAPLFGKLLTSATRHVVRLSYLEAIARKAKRWLNAIESDPDGRAQADQALAALKAELVKARTAGEL